METGKVLDGNTVATERYRDGNEVVSRKKAERSRQKVGGRQEEDRVFSG